MAAPAFVQAALGDGAPSYFRLAGRTLYATQRSEVSPRDVVCGLSRTAQDGTPQLLPEQDDAADVVELKLRPVTLRPLAAAAVFTRKRWHVVDPAFAADHAAMARLSSGDLSIVGAEQLVVSAGGALVAAVEQPAHSTKFAFEPGCKLRMKITQSKQANGQGRRD